MIIECLTRREGTTTVTLEGVKYLFMPIAGSKKGISTTSICEINTEKHLEYLLETNPDGKPIRPFREYDAKITAREQIEYESKLGGYMGLSIQKFKDSGYVAVDLRDKKHPKYAGSNSRWVDDLVSMTPWPTEFQAFEFLREEVEMGGISEPEEEKKPIPKKVQEKTLSTQGV